MRSRSNFSKSPTGKDTKRFKSSLDYGSLIIFNEAVPICQMDSNGEPKTLSYRLVITKKRFLDSLIDLNFALVLHDNIFFLLQSNLNFDEFSTIKNEQQTKVGFEQFAYQIINMIRNSKKKDGEYEISLAENKQENENQQTKWILTFNQIIDIKKISILTLIFTEASDEEKYNHAKSMLYDMKKRLMIKEKENELFNTVLKSNDSVMYDQYFSKMK